MFDKPTKLIVSFSRFLLKKIEVYRIIFMLLNYVSHLYYNAIKFERSFFMRKIFVVLDDALISSNDTTLRLGNDNLIVIPYPVVQRLQNFQGTIEKSKTAKEILAYLETFNLEQLSQEGVAQRNGRNELL